MIWEVAAFVTVQALAFLAGIVLGVWYCGHRHRCPVYRNPQLQRLLDEIDYRSKAKTPKIIARVPPPVPPPRKK